MCRFRRAFKTSLVSRELLSFLLSLLSSPRRVLWRTSTLSLSTSLPMISEYVFATLYFYRDGCELTRHIVFVELSWEQPHQEQENSPVSPWSDRPCPWNCYSGEHLHLLPLWRDCTRNSSWHSYALHLIRQASWWRHVGAGPVRSWPLLLSHEGTYLPPCRLRLMCQEEEIFMMFLYVLIFLWNTKFTYTFLHFELNHISLRILLIIAICSPVNHHHSNNFFCLLNLGQV